MTGSRAQVSSFGKILYRAAFLLAEFYMLVNCGKGILKGYGAYRNFSYKAALVLLAVALVYGIMTLRSCHSAGHCLREFGSRFLTYEQIFLVFLLFWYILVCILVKYLFGEYRVRENEAWIFSTGITGLLFFPFANYSGAEAKQRIELLLKPVILICAVFTAWLCWQYFLMNEVTLPSGNTLIMARKPELIMGLQIGSINHNVTGRFGLALFGLSLYMVFTQRPARKLLYAICAVVFSVLIVLTNSRTNWYISFLLLTLSVFLWCWNCLDRRGISFRILASLLLAVLVAILYRYFRVAVFRLLDLTTHFTAAGSSVQAALPPPTETGKAADSFIRRYDPSDSSFGSRLSVYRACIRLMFSRKFIFFFGVTPSDVVRCFRTYPGVSQTYPYGHAHNFFLQMGVSYGVPVMLATVVFSVSLFLRSVRIIFINREKLFSGAWMVPLLTMCILAGDMVEAELNAGTGILCTVFYLFAGWTVALDREARPESGGESK